MNAVNQLHFITGEDVYVTPAIYRLNVDLLTRRHPFHLGVLGFCLLFFLAEVLLLPGNLIRSLRHRAEQTTRMAWLARVHYSMVVVAGLAFTWFLGCWGLLTL
jgi:hypothetical protein